MEKKRSSGPVGACEKFFKAIAANSPFRPKRRISSHHRLQDSKPSNPSAKTHHHQTQKHPKPVVAPSEAVPIKFEYSAPDPYAKSAATTSQLPVAPNNGKVASGPAPNKNMQPPVSQFVQAKNIASKHKPEAAAAQEKRYKATTGRRMESSNNKTNANSIIDEDEDVFSKYIKRAGIKIRAPSSVGGDGKINAPSATGGEGTAGEGHFSDYINRAKQKMIRTMSSFAGAGTDSNK